MATVVADRRATGATTGPGTARQAAAVRLGTERRRLFLAGTFISLLAPLLPYLTGAWETIWYTVASTGWPLPLRTVLFLVGFALAMAVVSLPLGFYGGYVLGHRFKLSHQSLLAWGLDWVKGTVLGAVLSAVGGSVFLWLVANSGGAWWWLFGTFLTAMLVVLVFLTPYVLVPLFFAMRPLDDQATEERIRALVDRAGTQVGQICSLDFSRRTAEANAAVIGFGRSRRVILADTLLAHFPADEVDAVVAHELGHHVSRDVPRLIAVNLAILWLGLALGAWLRPVALPVLSLPSLAYTPGYPELFVVAEVYLLLTSPIVNWCSRRFEAAADTFALRVTGHPEAFAAAMRRLADQNLGELAPPAWAQALLASHPSLQQRIAFAEGWNA